MNRPLHPSGFPVVTADEMREVDRIMIEEMGISSPIEECGFRSRSPHPRRSLGRCLDSLIGYALAGPPAGRTASLISWANTSSAPIVSLDAPSGLDVTTGSAPGACIVAESTLTLAAPKQGLLAASEVGELFVADISVPSSVYARLGFEVGSPSSTHPICAVIRDSPTPR